MTKEQIKAKISVLEHMMSAMTSKASLREKADLKAKIDALRKQL